MRVRCSLLASAAWLLPSVKGRVDSNLRQDPKSGVFLAAMPINATPLAGKLLMTALGHARHWAELLATRVLAWILLLVL